MMSINVEAIDLLVFLLGEKGAMIFVGAFFVVGLVAFGAAFVVISKNNREDITCADFGSGMCPGDEATIDPYICKQLHNCRKEKKI